MPCAGPDRRRPNPGERASIGSVAQGSQVGASACVNHVVTAGGRGRFGHESQLETACFRRRVVVRSGGIRPTLRAPGKTALLRLRKDTADSVDPFGPWHDVQPLRPGPPARRIRGTLSPHRMVHPPCGPRATRGKTRSERFDARGQGASPHQTPSPSLSVAEIKQSISNIFSDSYISRSKPSAFRTKHSSRFALYFLAFSLLISRTLTL